MLVLAVVLLGVVVVYEPHSPLLMMVPKVYDMIRLLLTLFTSSSYTYLTYYQHSSCRYRCSIITVLDYLLKAM